MSRRCALRIVQRAPTARKASNIPRLRTVQSTDEDRAHRARLGAWADRSRLGRPQKLAKALGLTFDFRVGVPKSSKCRVGGCGVRPGVLDRVLFRFRLLLVSGG